jgi:hypothetical protein
MCSGPRVEGCGREVVCMDYKHVVGDKKTKNNRGMLGKGRKSKA